MAVVGWVARTMRGTRGGTMRGTWGGGGVRTAVDESVDTGARGVVVRDRGLIIS